MKETLAVLLKRFKKVMTHLLQGFDVNDVTFLVDYVVHLAGVGVVGLSLLFMLVKPLARLRLGHGFR